jgi:hypothetical protein
MKASELIKAVEEVLKQDTGVSDPEIVVSSYENNAWTGYDMTVATHLDYGRLRLTVKARVE